MAVDTNSLAYLIDPFWQGEGINGKPLVAGYMCVYIAGTDQKYITWQNWDGTRHPFKIPLGSDGRATILVEVQYTYDCYLYDSFGNLVCSRLNVKPAIGGDVTVYGLTEVWHDGTMSGEGTPQSPLSVVSAGKVYDGIEPIVVNNIENKISAQHIPLGVQDPLYFVEDSETACVIGISGGVVPEGTMAESALGFVNNKITGYNGSAFSAGNEYEAGSYIDITNNTINVVNLPTSADVQNIVDVATSGLMPSGNYLTKESADTLYAPTGNYLTGLPEDLVYTADITGLATTAQLDEKLDKSDSGNFYPMEGNPSGFLTAHQSLAGYATEDWVTGQGYLTAHQSLDGLMSADLLEISDNKITGYNGTAFAGQGGGGVTGDYELSAGSGISIVDYPLEQKTVISVTAQGGNPEVEQAVIDNSATWGSVTAKQDSLTFGYHDTAISSIDESAIYDNSAHARINTLAGRISDLSSNKLDNSAIATAEYDGEFTSVHTINNLPIWSDYSNWADTAGRANEAKWDSTNRAISALPDSATVNSMISLSITGKADTSALTAYAKTWQLGELEDVVDTKLDTTAFSTVSSTFLTAVPAGTMNESAFDYSGGMITAYNGSAFKDVALTDVVTANSGAWGGSALPISAGPGIALNLVDGVLVISTAGE